VNATGYLDAVLADPDVPPADRETVKAALPRLDEIARETKGGALFADLDEAGRIAVVERLRHDETGYRTIWLGLMFTVEAMFGDPVYGGNPGGVGWTWMGYAPPKPRPTAPQGSFPR
jgi:gluconate 2-dehydrogenase gamma chain